MEETRIASRLIQIILTTFFFSMLLFIYGMFHGGTIRVTRETIAFICMMNFIAGAMAWLLVRGALRR